VVLEFQRRLRIILLRELIALVENEVEVLHTLGRRQDTMVARIVRKAIQLRATENLLPWNHDGNKEFSNEARTVQNLGVVVYSRVCKGGSGTKLNR
jgi:hypothetical protein